MTTNKKFIDLSKCKHLTSYVDTQESLQESFSRQLMDSVQRLQERKEETKKIAERIDIIYHNLNLLVSEGVLILDQETRRQIKDTLILFCRVKASAGSQLMQKNIGESEYFQSRILELLEVEENTNE